MKVLQYILKIIFRKRWLILSLATIAAIIVYILMSAQPKVYKSKTVIYTGIGSGYDVVSSGGERQDWLAVENTIENLISIVQSENTLENVFLRLVARNLSHLDIHNDNEFQTAESSRELAECIDPALFDLVDFNSEMTTYENLKKYYNKDQTNMLKQLFHWNSKHYSYKALSAVIVDRVGESDMISISYENDDPYIVYNTLCLLIEEFTKIYIDLRYEQTNDVVGYFENELRIIKAELNEKENDLTSYNTQNQIINYEEQTKQIVERAKGIDQSIEEVQRKLDGARQHLALLEEKMGTASALFRSNANFIGKLHNIGTLYSANTEATDEETKNDISNKISDETVALQNITGEISAARHTKEGLAAESLTAEWLVAILDETKAEAELAILKKNKAEIDNEYRRFSPVGSSLKRQSRDINFSEQNYLSNLDALNEARLRQKNLQLTSATFKTLTPPSLALQPEKTKTKINTILTFVFVIILLSGIEVIAEFFNQKPYDKESAEKLFKLPVIGALPLKSAEKFDSICTEFSVNQVGNAILNYFDRTKSNNIINIISLEKEEGKSYTAQALKEFFARLDTKAEIVTWNKDFTADSKYYLMASSIYDFAITEDNNDSLSDADTIIVEYPPLHASSFPTKLLSAAAINIIVADTERRIKGIDQILLRQLREYDKKDNLLVLLNGADKDTAGLFTGILPPYTLRHKIRFAMWNLGSIDSSTVLPV